jgi:hypothetical protein
MILSNYIKLSLPQIHKELPNHVRDHGFNC